MKLFSVKTLSTVTMLSTAVLLSACCGCGGSDSSGSDTKTDTPKAESNSSGSQKEKDKKKEQTKKEKYSLIGYWKSECLNTNEIGYYHITENNNKLKSEGLVQEFKNKSCTGKSEITNDGIVDLGTQKKPKINVEFINKDTFSHIQNDDETDNKTVKTKFTRSSADEFNKMKNQAKQEKLAKEKAIQDKADMLKGYWLSGCTNGKTSEHNKDGSSFRHYMKITEKNNKFIIDKKYESFERHGCNPKDVFYIIFDKKPQTFDLKRIAEMPQEIMSHDKWRDYGDTYTRISEDTYNSLKEYDKYPQFN